MERKVIDEKYGASLPFAAPVFTFSGCLVDQAPNNQVIVAVLELIALHSSSGVRLTLSPVDLVTLVPDWFLPLQLLSSATSRGNEGFGFSV